MIDDLDAHLDGLATDLDDLRKDALGIAAVGQALATFIVARQQEYRVLHRITVMSSMALAWLAASLTGIALGHDLATALLTGGAAGLAAGGAYFVTCTRDTAHGNAENDGDRQVRR